MESLSDTFILLILLLVLFSGGNSKESVKSLKEAYKTFLQLRRKQQEFTDELRREILSDVEGAVEPLKSTLDTVNSSNSSPNDFRVKILEARIRELEKEIEELRRQAGKDGKGPDGSR